MTGSDSSAFNIDSSTGKITTNSELDYETKRDYQFMVKASDGGQQVNTGTQSVTVVVVDVNDNAPQFVGSYSKRIKEDARLDKNVITVKANDSDSGTSVVVFIIRHG